MKLDKNSAVDSGKLWPGNELDKVQSEDLSKPKSREGNAYLLQHDDEKLRNFVAPISVELKPLQKDSVLYADKRTTEPELPEVVVCHEENTHHAVKDICMDEGIPPRDKFLNIPESNAEESPNDSNNTDAVSESKLTTGHREAQSLSRPEDRGTEQFSSQLKMCQVESTYLGPISYSGSLSMRSDSSTTSARSFAFPILQPEWKSSPIRMAKAKRKHRGWRHSILCCRF